MRESEARYRTLVEHAPEVIVVFDVDRGKFVDVNDNACRFFKMDRATLARVRARQDHARRMQPDGTPSFGVSRGFIDGALAGEAPVFEWVHCDSAGHAHALRGALRAPAELEPAPDPREHHRHHRAQAQRGDRGGRAPRIREDCGERAAARRCSRRSARRSSA